MEQFAERLAQTHAFGKLARAERIELARLAHRRQLDAGEFLCHQGEVWTHAIFVAAGQLRWAMLSPSGKEYMLYALEPGRVFWGHSFFDDEPMPASLQATQPTEVYVWHRDVILPIVDRNPVVWREITKALVATMRQAREIIYGLAFQPVAGRLAKLLLTQFPAPEKQSFERSITLHEIAARVASTPEVVSRVLHQFQAEGILEITRASITLNNRAALARVVESTDGAKKSDPKE
ncbi:MAG: Crp/Fnr family transcriptional regulator [Chloroflexi bacterium]|nr:Crp/Fnr family transcriptional regulator [Chloroflexota bacterium]